MLESLGFKELLDIGDFLRLLFRLVLNLFFSVAVVRLVYYRFHRRNDYVFTYLLLNLITFTLCFLLRKVPMEMGFALGLFAVFGILRYRTEAIRTRDLTYLFIVIGIAILNAVANEEVSIAELLLANASIVGLSWFLEASPRSGLCESHIISYDNLALLKPRQRAALVADLRDRTGLDVTDVTIGDVDLLRDSAQLTVFVRRSSECNRGKRS